MHDLCVGFLHERAEITMRKFQARQVQIIRYAYVSIVCMRGILLEKLVSRWVVMNSLTNIVISMLISCFYNVLCYAV